MAEIERVFILKVFILDDRKPHRYPEFSIYPIEAFCFLSLEECISKISDYGPGDYGYCYVVESHSCGIDMYFGTKERWLFLPDGTLFSHTFSGDEAFERNMEYQGRKPEDCHFKEGDIVEMMDDETVTLGIVYHQPPTPAEIEAFRKERREHGGWDEMVDGAEDRYIILVNHLRDKGNSVYMRCRRGPLASCLLPPSMPVPEKLRKRLQGLLEQVKKEESK